MTNTLRHTFIRNFTQGKIFTAHYIKKTTGKFSSMTVRCGVRSHTSGGQLSYNPSSKNHLSVFKMSKKESDRGYRILAVDNLVALTIGGKSYSREDLIKLQVESDKAYRDSQIEQNFFSNVA